MIVELSTDFSEAEKNLLKQCSDVYVKLYIDLNKLVDRFSYCSENGVMSDEIIEHKAIEMPSMMPNRIILFDWCHHLVERKNEPGSWYVSHGSSENGEISCQYKCDDLKTALESI